MADNDSSRVAGRPVTYFGVTRIVDHHARGLGAALAALVHSRAAHSAADLGGMARDVVAPAVAPQPDSERRNVVF